MPDKKVVSQNVATSTKTKVEADVSLTILIDDLWYL